MMVHAITRPPSQLFFARTARACDKELSMKKFLVAAAVAMAFAAPASAQVFDNVGECISDGLYGNQPNMSDGSLGGPSDQTPGSQAGNVVPSQSPGPFVNNPSDPSNPTRGRSVGGFQQDGINVPEICRAISG
jgi:opacity protein-like surface antigen